MYPFLAAITCLAIYFVVYTCRLKHPPVMRKLHDLRWSLRFCRDTRKVVMRGLLTRPLLIEGTFKHALYPVTGDIRYIADARPRTMRQPAWHPLNPPFLKRMLLERPTLTELLEGPSFATVMGARVK